jgi:hypothetical protein
VEEESSSERTASDSKRRDDVGHVRDVGEDLHQLVDDKRVRHVWRPADW